MNVNMNEKVLLQYANPKTEEEILTNILYLQRDIRFMKSLNLIEWDCRPTIKKHVGGSINGKFIMSVMPKINAYVRELWEQEKLPYINQEIKELKLKLKQLEND